jgi:hypothetical protein
MSLCPSFLFFILSFIPLGEEEAMEWDQVLLPSLSPLLTPLVVIFNVSLLQTSPSPPLHDQSTTAFVCCLPPGDILITLTISISTLDTTGLSDCLCATVDLT